MNKNELVEEISNKTGFTKADTLRFVNATVETISQQLRKGKDVQLVGFGTFRVTQRKARNGRNPQTGKPIKIQAKKVAVFKAGKGLKEAVN
ncbi:MAG: DNA-binding protein HU [Chlamydiae bacterium RIFCSPHIGHO2_12_FULL_49_11]|nr:MAG: DNA-binding protein HU [Chlamydiae bacterium RIFCSPHIGHO2_12_FULL_49_11]